MFGGTVSLVNNVRGDIIHSDTASVFKKSENQILYRVLQNLCKTSYMQVVALTNHRQWIT